MKRTAHFTLAILATLIGVLG
ncbi:MAG: hypothetical protein QOH95_2382, partial [Gaiellaceae bacterium]|nr:hypothetical protein [Gaiellaceae bacterium]